jgi:hypothetical protein
MGIFDVCHEINDLLESGRETEGRDALIRLLHRLERDKIPYGPLVNSLIRETGLYPYLQEATANWSDRFAFQAFRVDVGSGGPETLHREQSLLLKRLLAGESLAVSAPTSFGKSFIIDAFISIRRPKNVVIIVPTLALTDETRRRIQKKFASVYKVITTASVTLAERNIFVFPQERAVGYVDALAEIDLLVIDEFYKASSAFDKDRAPALLRAILELSRKAKQRYFLAPNITRLQESAFTRGMEFVPLDFNTVFLEKHEMYEEIGEDRIRKSEALVNILAGTSGKSLIYAGSYSGIDAISNLLIERVPAVAQPRMAEFANWLAINYDPNWQLTNLVRRGTGIHNGQLHRSLSQIQIRLFEDQSDGLKNLVSTSSIIEGVNTSAENVLLWSNKNGAPSLTDFTYRNIIGRAGRMFKHFVGQIYILAKPPKASETQLELTIPDALLGGLDERVYADELSKEQIAKIIQYKDDMRRLVGAETYRRLEGLKLFQTSDCLLVHKIAKEIVENSAEWTRLGGLNSDFANYWDSALYRIIKLHPGGWDAPYKKVVSFIKILKDNWTSTIPQLLNRLERHDIGIDLFFKLERHVSFKLASLLNDVSVIRREVLGDEVPDISPFIARVSSAFLPPLVYELEEYGLPRMIARKIHVSRLLDLESQDTPLHDVIAQFKQVGLDRVVTRVNGLDSFDHYILEYFFEGLGPSRRQ